MRIRINQAKARDLKEKGLLPAEKKEELKLMDITLRSCARDGRVGAHVIERLQAQADNVVYKQQQKPSWLEKKPLWLRKVLFDLEWEQAQNVFCDCSQSSSARILRNHDGFFALSCRDYGLRTTLAA